MGGVGGRPPAAFGIVVRGAGGRRVLATQDSPRDASLILTRSPHGRVTRVRRHPRHPDAGAFRTLHAVGRAARRGAAVTARHRFRENYVETAWEIETRRRGLRAEAQFPSWGPGATITAALRGGGTRTLAPGAGAVDVAGVAYFHLAGPRGGYVVVLPRRGRRPARAQRVARQPSAPRAGPTLVIALPHGAGLRVRIAPAAGPEQAAEVAARLA